MKEEEVEEVVEEVVVGVKRKVEEEETKPRKTKKKRRGKSRRGKGFTWTAKEEDALLKGIVKYGMDFKRIREDNGKVLGGRSPGALQAHLYRYFPEKYEELRAATPRKYVAWTAEEDAALKRGRKEHGTDWDVILKSENKVLGRRTLRALEERHRYR